MRNGKNERKREHTGVWDKASVYVWILDESCRVCVYECVVYVHIESIKMEFIIIENSNAKLEYVFYNFEIVKRIIMGDGT